MIAEDLFALQTWMNRNTTAISFCKNTLHGRSRMATAGKIDDDTCISYVSSKQSTVNGYPLQSGFVLPTRYFVMIPRGKVRYDDFHDELKVFSSAAFIYPLFAKFMQPEELYMPLVNLFLIEISKLDGRNIFRSDAFSTRLKMKLDERNDFDELLRYIQNNLRETSILNHNLRVYLNYPVKDQMPRGILYKSLRYKELDQLAQAMEMGCLIENIIRLRTISLLNGYSDDEYFDNGYNKAHKAIKSNFHTDFDFVIQSFMNSFNASSDKPVEKFSF